MANYEEKERAMINEEKDQRIILRRIQNRGCKCYCGQPLYIEREWKSKVCKRKCGSKYFKTLKKIVFVNYTEERIIKEYQSLILSTFDESFKDIGQDLIPIDIMHVVFIYLGIPEWNLIVDRYLYIHE